MTEKSQDSKSDNSDRTSARKGATGISDIADKKKQPKEVGGREGPDPTRYGDWEINGRCVDF